MDRSDRYLCFGTGLLTGVFLLLIGYVLFEAITNHVSISFH